MNVSSFKINNISLETEIVLHPLNGQGPLNGCSYSAILREDDGPG